jgi:hypothetical protein
VRRILSVVVLPAVLAIAAIFPARAAESPADARADSNYGSNLSRVYFAHQRLLAVRDACDQALPGDAAANEKAYSVWQSRHKALLEELDVRFTLMVRGVSRHEREYLRNLGKYEGAVIEYRNKERDELLAQPREGIGQGCADFRAYLAGSGSDFHKEYAEELRILRQRKLPK